MILHTFKCLILMPILIVDFAHIHAVWCWFDINQNYTLIFFFRTQARFIEQKKQGPVSEEKKHHD